MYLYFHGRQFYWRKQITKRKPSSFDELRETFIQEAVIDINYKIRTTQHCHCFMICIVDTIKIFFFFSSSFFFRWVGFLIICFLCSVLWPIVCSFCLFLLYQVSIVIYSRLLCVCVIWQISRNRTCLLFAWILPTEHHLAWSKQNNHHVTY